MNELEKELKKIHDEHEADMKIMMFIGYFIFLLALIYASSIIYISVKVLGE